MEPGDLKQHWKRCQIKPTLISFRSAMPSIKSIVMESLKVVTRGSLCRDLIQEASAAGPKALTDIYYHLLPLPSMLNFSLFWPGLELPRTTLASKLGLSYLVLIPDSSEPFSWLRWIVITGIVCSLLLLWMDTQRHDPVNSLCSKHTPFCLHCVVATQLITVIRANHPCNRVAPFFDLPARGD